VNQNYTEIGKYLKVTSSSFTVPVVIKQIGTAALENSLSISNKVENFYYYYYHITVIFVDTL
jgi:hypothetical protein